jgi:hypothetical protein
MLKPALLATLMTGCFIDPPHPPEPPPEPPLPGERVEIMTVTPNLDLLFVIDDSGTMADKQASLRQAFPEFMAQLDSAPGGRPNLHIGVISTDMGAKGRLDSTPGTSVGTVGQGGCANLGKAGHLQINNAPIIPDEVTGTPRPFFEVARDGTSNISGSLEDAFTTMAALGATGCGFEQQLHAMRVALEDTGGANKGFLRESANLGIVMLTDEDDCSMTHSALLGPEGGPLGPLQSFRCFRFGVTCAQDINSVGEKSGCEPSPASEFVEDVAPFANFLAGLKSTPNRVLFGAVIGAPNPVAVELRPINGQMQNAVAHSCDLQDGGIPLQADPGVRLAAMANQFATLGGQTQVDSICSRDLTPQVTNIGAKLAALVDNTCLPAAQSASADCIVEDQSDFQASVDTLLPCTDADAPGTSCFRITADTACSSGQRLVFTRPVPPISTDRVSTLKCIP